jgi:hypothetical protein
MEHQDFRQPHHALPHQVATADLEALDAWVAKQTPGATTDEALDDFADEVLLARLGSTAAPPLIRALQIAQSTTTRAAVALALADCAEPNDTTVVDALVACYRAASTDTYLAPALLDALGVLAAGGGLARAATLNELLRLDRMGDRYLLVKSAKVAGRLDAAQQEPALRERLREWAKSDDAAVVGESRQQIALMVLGDALLADESVSMIEALQEARAAFDAAEAAEEHRPDSAVFRQLVDMVLALFDLPASPAARASAIATAADAVRQRLGDLAQHDWHGYRARL